ncbi:PDDEXK nuclease domain-containing protein [Flavobacterium sp.]|uniref:PDDEXK nuclease domain-containing protein n=1 Tax=Flavobacterium sp. TaxID=239 RepID=UPI003D09AEB7
MNKNLPDKILFADISNLIQESKQQVASTINAAISILYWQIGHRILSDVLNHQRAEYGEKIVIELSVQLTENFGKGWSEKQLRQCIKFVEVFPEMEIVYTLCRQLSWSHIRQIMYINDSLKREFYIEMCKIEKWSVRTFKERINSMLYERTAISSKPDELIKSELAQLKSAQKLSPDLIFRDPYVLDFLGLKDTYSEKDLEDSILFELEKFIIELGSDFAFMGRQKRITIDNEDYYIDLLFYHRRLKALIAIELKLGKFEAAHKGQMELYLRWLEKHETLEGENPPIGLILCASKNKEHVELLQLDKSNIKVAEYLTQLPDFKLIENKLHQAIKKVKNKIDNQE